MLRTVHSESDWRSGLPELVEGSKAHQRRVEAGAVKIHEQPAHYSRHAGARE
jgi:hypothetical protein